MVAAKHTFRSAGSGSLRFKGEVDDYDRAKRFASRRFQFGGRYLG